MENLTGVWCKQNEVVCDYHADTHPIKPKQECSGMFFGTCSQGSCYVPSTAEEEDKQIRIEQCTADHFGYWYKDLIGEVLDIRSEFLDTFLVHYNDNLLGISRKDCTVLMKEAV